MAGLVVAGLTTWQYEGTTAKKKHEHRISYLTGGGLLMEGRGARPTGRSSRASSLRTDRREFLRNPQSCHSQAAHPGGPAGGIRASRCATIAVVRSEERRVGKECRS